MKKLIFITILLLCICGVAFFSCRQQKQPPENAIAQMLLKQVDSFALAKNKMLIAAQSDNTSEDVLKADFLELRLTYKKIEWAVEYFDPANSRFVNGPPVQEIETVSGQVFEPAGLQVIETLLYPKFDLSKKQEIIRQLNLLQTGIDRYKTRFRLIEIFNWQVFDAAKQEVFRVESLGIAGFDDPLTLKCMHESAVALQSAQWAVSQYANEARDLDNEFDSAKQYLNGHTDFNSFDRAEFITKFGNPLSTGISLLSDKLGLKPMHYNRLLNQNARTMFDKDAFNVNAYSPDQSSYISEKKIALGRILFADPILSGNGIRSCQSCHQPDKAFTDGMIKNTIIGTKKTLPRNTPTIINAALQPDQFFDLRAHTLEDQVNAVVSNPDEMHGSVKAAAERLWQNPVYRKLFAEAFPANGRNHIDTLEVVNAIGSYVRSLTALNSRFDDYMRGDKRAMNQNELNGFNLFMGKAKCGTCHYMPLFNGTFPPRYAFIESEVIGVPKTLAEKEIDDDIGRYSRLKVNAFKHAFKISTVRNISRTAPYMHNGVFTTLKQVMDFYNKGGGAGLGYKVENQTLDAGKLNLTGKESDDVIAFMKTLDSKM